MNILKEIKSALYKIRRAKPAKHKPKNIVKSNTSQIVKAKPKLKPKKEKRELIKTVINGRELSLGQIALFYNLKPHTVYARYRVGNRGRLLIRPAPQRKQNLT